MSPFQTTALDTPKPSTTGSQETARPSLDPDPQQARAQAAALVVGEIQVPVRAEGAVHGADLAGFRVHVTRLEAVPLVQFSLRRNAHHPRRRGLLEESGLDEPLVVEIRHRQDDAARRIQRAAVGSVALERQVNQHAGLRTGMNSGNQHQSAETGEPQAGT